MLLCRQFEAFMCPGISKKTISKRTAFLRGWKTWRRRMDQLPTGSMSKSWMRPTMDFPNQDVVYSSWVSGRNSWKPHSNGQNPRRRCIWRMFYRKTLLAVADPWLQSKQLDVLTKTLWQNFRRILGVNLSKWNTHWTTTKNNDSSIWTPRHTSWCRFFRIPHRTQDGIATIMVITRPRLDAHHSGCQCCPLVCSQ